MKLRRWSSHFEMGCSIFDGNEDDVQRVALTVPLKNKELDKRYHISDKGNLNSPRHMEENELDGRR